MHLFENKQALPKKSNKLLGGFFRVFELMRFNYSHPQQKNKKTMKNRQRQSLASNLKLQNDYTNKEMLLKAWIMFDFFCMNCLQAVYLLGFLNKILTL